MDAKKTTRIPQLCAHKATGQSFIRIDGRAIYFGRTGLPETIQKYHQFIAEWLASGCQSPIEPEQITVQEVCARFWVYAQGYYVKADGTPTSEMDCYRSAIRPLLDLYGLNNASEFGPKALKLIRDKMIKRGWTRSTVNKNIGRIRTIFRWAGENELSKVDLVDFASLARSWLFEIITLEIGNLNIGSYVVSYHNLGAGSTVYIDRGYTYTGGPAYIGNKTFIQTANDDKYSTGDSFLTFTINMDCTIYVLHDDTITTKPTWLNSFVDTGDNVTSDNPETYSVFYKDYNAGAVTLGGNGGGVSSSMYTVVIVEK